MFAIVVGTGSNAVVYRFKSETQRDLASFKLRNAGFVVRNLK